MTQRSFAIAYDHNLHIHVSVRLSNSIAPLHKFSIELNAAASKVSLDSVILEKVILYPEFSFVLAIIQEYLSINYESIDNE